MKDRIIDSLTLQQYLDGTLDPRRMHELEKQALEDDFLADALEGYTYIIEPAEKLSLLQQRLADRVLEQEANKKAFSVSVQRLSVASAAGVMFLLAVILFWMNGYKTPELTKQVQVELSAPSQLNPADGIKQAGAIAKTVASPVFALVEHTSSRSEPVAGWDEYSRYIQKNLPSQSLNNLVISFTINSNGRPVGLKLLEGNLNDHSKQIFRLIENGPLWKSADTKEVKVRINKTK